MAWRSTRSTYVYGRIRYQAPSSRATSTSRCRCLAVWWNRRPTRSAMTLCSSHTASTMAIRRPSRTMGWFHRGGGSPAASHSAPAVRSSHDQNAPSAPARVRSWTQRADGIRSASSAAVRANHERPDGTRQIASSTSAHVCAQVERRPNPMTVRGRLVTGTPSRLPTCARGSHGVRWTVTSHSRGFESPSTRTCTTSSPAARSRRCSEAAVPSVATTPGRAVAAQARPRHVSTALACRRTVGCTRTQIFARTRRWICDGVR